MSDSNDLKTVHKIVDGEKQPVRIQDLEPGDEFVWTQVRENGKVEGGRDIATGNPYLQEDGVWAIMTKPIHRNVEGD